MKKISKTLETMYHIRSPLATINSYSSSLFYRSFSKCDCTIGMHSIIGTYKNSWKLFQKWYNEIPSLQEVQSDSELRFLEELLDAIKKVIFRINFKSIYKEITDNNPYPQREYISETVIPSTAESAKELIKALDTTYEKLIEKIK